MRVAYDVLDPTGNITILVRTPVPEADQPAIAARLMELEPETEQVGFLKPGGNEGLDTDCDIDLRMAGGEFCGNASMCAAVIAAMEPENSGQSRRSVKLRVSGASGIVRAEVTRRPDGDWSGTVDMPRPAAIEEASLPGAGPLPVVRFEGISHIILQKQIPRDKAQELAPVWCKLLGADALGLMFLDSIAGRLTPLVFVPAAHTLCWETSCASGTTAVCAYLAQKNPASYSDVSDRETPNGEVSYHIRLHQPGGELQAAVSWDGTIQLTGKVKLLRRGEAEVTSAL